MSAADGSMMARMQHHRRLPAKLDSTVALVARAAGAAAVLGGGLAVVTGIALWWQAGEAAMLRFVDTSRVPEWHERLLPLTTGLCAVGVAAILFQVGCWWPRLTRRSVRAVQSAGGLLLLNLAWWATGHRPGPWWLVLLPVAPAPVLWWSPFRPARPAALLIMVTTEDLAPGPGRTRARCWPRP